MKQRRKSLHLSSFVFSKHIVQFIKIENIKSCINSNESCARNSLTWIIYSRREPHEQCIYMYSIVLN